MASIEEQHFSDWEDLSYTINEYFTHFNNYIFRGQGNDTWTLEPSISRMLKGSDYKLNERKSAIDDHFNKFKENIRGRVSFDFNNSKSDEIWALGQHYGLATPLLDWSRSPYVALFFALNNCSEDTNGCLYAIFESDIHQINDLKKGNQKNVHVVNPLTNDNDRLVNQRGLFLHVPINVNLEKWISSGKKFDYVTMYKFTFPNSIKHDALSALNNMNINHLSLFPDLGGSSLHSNYELMAEPYLSKKRKEVNGKG
jgi:hypothetical protein